MKKQNTLILIAILLLLLCAIYFAHKKAPVQIRQKLFKTPPSQITSISLSTATDSLFIQKDLLTDIWYAHHPLNVKISPVKLQNFFHSVIGIDRFDKILTNDTFYFEKYNVTYETGTLLTIYDDAGYLLEQYLIGMSDLYTYGAARSTNSTIVYELSKNIEYEVSPILSNWRIPDIINFNRTEVDSILVVYSGGKYSLVNSDSGWWFRNSHETFQLTKAHRIYVRAMNQLENLKTFSFFDNQWELYADVFHKPYLIITIYYKEKPIDTLTFASHTEDRCIIMLNNLHDTLYQGVYDMSDRFTRSPVAWKTDVVKMSL